MASLIRNTPLDQLFANQPTEAVPRRAASEQAFGEVLSRAERTASDDRTRDEVTRAEDADTSSLRESDVPTEKSQAEPGAEEDTSPAAAPEDVRDANPSQTEVKTSEDDSEEVSEELVGELALSEIAVALSQGVTPLKLEAKSTPQDQAAAVKADKAAQLASASGVSQVVIESGAVTAELGIEKQAAVPAQTDVQLAQTDSNTKAVSAQTPSQSDDGADHEQTANRTAANALATDASKPGGGPNPSGAFELPRELQAVLDTTATRDTGTRVSVAQQAATDQRVEQSDQDALNTARLNRGLASAVKQNGGVVTLRLTPPEIGTVRIELQMSGTTLSAAFHTETASAMSLINQQMDQLRTSLETQGLNVDKISVQTIPSAQNHADAGQQDQGNERNENGKGSQSRTREDRREDNESRDAQQEKPNSFNDQLDDASSEAA